MNKTFMISNHNSKRNELTNTYPKEKSRSKINSQELKKISDENIFSINE